jgi:hypothetical protein
MLVKNAKAQFPSIRKAAQTPITVSVDFDSLVSAAGAILTGFNVQFSPKGDDHHLGQLDVRLETGKPSGASVPVTVHFNLQDWSDDHDDLYEGTVYFTVIAE